MRIVFLGTGGSNPPPGRGGPALLIDNDYIRLLIDAGDHTLQRLRLLGYSPCDIDAVYITHSHLDHWAGLFQLGVARAAEGCKRICLYMHPNVASELEQTLRSIMPSSVNLEVKVVEKEVSLRGVKLVLVEVKHTVPTYGVMVYEDGEPKLLYTSDTCLDETVLSRLKMLGSPYLLVPEATFADNVNEDVLVTTGHMSVMQALRLKEEVKATMVAPVHLSPDSLRQLLSYRRLPRGVIVPVDGLVVTV